MFSFSIYSYYQNVNRRNYQVNATKKIITASMLAALTFVATVIIKIPSPIGGYLNLGDAVVLLSGYLLSPLYAFLAAAVGSALGDVYSGYLVYLPTTFVIKGIMSLIAHFGQKKAISGAIAEAFMIAGYYVFEGFLYGFTPSLINIPANAVQGVVGLIISLILIKYLKRLKHFN